MGKGDDQLPQLTWDLLYSTGRKEIISVLKTPSVSKKILCVVGVRNLRVCATIGEDGDDPIFKVLSVFEPQKKPFKVTMQLILCFEIQLHGDISLFL